MTETAFDLWSDAELIKALQSRGYTVRHNSEARRTLSWNRTAPMPAGVEFRDEAVSKIREQIAPEHIHFIVEPAIVPAFDGDFGRPELHRAILRVL